MPIPAVQINHTQIRKVAQIIKKMPDEDKGLNFYSFDTPDGEIVASNMYPELNHPGAVDFFSFACLHQFGFWNGDEDGYNEPLIGQFRGKRSKGSDLLWKTLKESLDDYPEIFAPEHLAEISENELRDEIFTDDNGPIPFQDFDKRLEITKNYGAYLVGNETRMGDLVKEANDTDIPLKTFLTSMDEVPGFEQDPLQKKSLLLAMALANRPEKFLNVRDSENWKPIVDYHLMRVALRLGLVEILDPELKKVNQERRWTDSESERIIRKAVFEAVQELIKESEKPMPFIDHTLWLARKYCPEMEKPNCEECIFSVPCEQKVELFQPVLRSIDY